jgi:hypothetical protein
MAAMNALLTLAFRSHPSRILTGGALVRQAPYAAVLGLALAGSQAALAQASASSGPVSPALTAQDLKPTVITENGRVDRVVLYRTMAAVTRVVRKDLAQGVWEVRIGNLPNDVDAARIFAKVHSVQGDKAPQPRLLSVDYVEKPSQDFTGTPEGMALTTRVEMLRLQLGAMGQDAADLDSMLQWTTQLGVRTAANATNDGGTAALSLDSVAEQLQFVGEERARLMQAKRELGLKAEQVQRELKAAEAELESKGGASRTERTAVVQLAQVADGPAVIELTYHLFGPEWAPQYSVRANGDRTAVEVEYDAGIFQATGEDWTDVTLALSTADATDESSPPVLEPFIVDEVRPVENQGVAYKRRGTGGAGGGGGGGFGGGLAAADKDGMNDYSLAEAGGAILGDSPALTASIEAMSGAAAVAEAGTAAVYELPRRVTVPSDMSSVQRTRVTTFTPEATFAYVAQPLHTQQVFLRGALRNSSDFLLLPGTARIFMGGDFIGSASMPFVAPKDEFKVFFGPDRALTAKREMLSRVTGTSGLFGGNLLTTTSYRITLENGTGRDIELEVIDRQPVSRNEKIEVKLEALSKPISTDRVYAETQKPLGFLRWDVKLPATARPGSGLVLSWNVLVYRPNDLQMTPLPSD